MLSGELFALALPALLALNVQIGGAGIEFLTEDTHEEAVACGRAGENCAVVPYLLCPAENEHYSARIASPFSRVAASVHEAISKRQRIRPMEEIGANTWGVGIYVSPAGNYATADSIQRVAIRRGGQTIEPITSTFAPVVLQGPAGTTRQVSKGFFSFPMDVFSPGADITIIFAGGFGEATCTLDRRRLSGLR